MGKRTADSMFPLWKTKTFLSSMQMQASGWDQVVHDAVIAGEPGVAVYLYDLPTGWTWMGSVPLATFVETSAKAHVTPATTKAVRGGVAYVASAVADKAPPAPVDGLNWEQQLAGLLSMYAGTTQTWEHAGRFVTGGHFIVLNYRKAGEREGRLRPIGLRDNNRVIPADQFHTLVRQVLSVDRERHPEWFA